MKSSSLFFYWLLLCVLSSCGDGDKTLYMNGNYFFADFTSAKVIDTKDSPLTDQVLGEKQTFDKQLEITMNVSEDLAEFAYVHNSKNIYYLPEFIGRQRVRTAENTQLGPDCTAYEKGVRSQPDMICVNGALTHPLPVYWKGIPVTPGLEKNAEYKEIVAHRGSAKNRKSIYPEKDEYIEYEIYLPIKMDRTTDNNGRYPMLPYDLRHNSRDLSLDFSIDAAIFLGAPSGNDWVVSYRLIPWKPVVQAMKKAELKLDPMDNN